MIFNVNGKNIAFGMQWRSIISRINVQQEARAAKSPLLWHADKAFFFGLLGSTDKKTKTKGPVYSGAIALINAYHTADEASNILLILQMPDAGGFVVCGIHQGRPKDGCDVVVHTTEQVESVIEQFTTICAQSPFLLIGNVELPGITSITLEDFADDVEASSLLKKAANSTIRWLAIAIVLGVAWFGGDQVYQKLKKDRRLKLAFAANQSKKSSQQLYSEEIAAKRLEPALPASSIAQIVQWVRVQEPSGGGWKMTKVSCKSVPTKHAVCTLDFERGSSFRATYKTFLAWAGDRFDSISFGEDGKTVTATAKIKDVPFSTIGAVLDAGKSERDERIDFGSKLQAASEFSASQTFGKFTPFGIPPGVVVGTLTPPLYSSSDWTVNGPVRRLSEIGNFPPYVLITSVDFTFTTTPGYEVKSSFAKFVVTGKSFSKHL